MIVTKAFALTVAMLYIAAGSAWSFMIERDAVIWAKGMTIEQGIQALEDRIVRAISANPRKLTS